MRYISVTLALTFALHQAALFTIAAQVPRNTAFEEMAEAERAFVRRAQDVGAAPAFIEFFAEDAVGFQSGRPASAQAELRLRPAPPRDPNVIFWWEPRYGDVAASGDLGWLTGPVRMGRKDRDGGKIRHGNYASIWKRQKDGSFKVVIDIGIDPPGEVPFAPGLVRAPFEKRYTASEIVPLSQASLLAADRALNAAARTSLADAVAKVAAPAIRVHRNGHLPFEGRDAALAWLKTQPAMNGAESLYAETARSGDLGYTWGSYEKGHYARTWVRDAAGDWYLSLDLDAPKPAKP
jgi:ketosteroid isomerase-like protein